MSKTERQHAEQLGELLTRLADLVKSDYDGVEWKEIRKIARYMWSGALIGQLLRYKERKK